MAMIARAKASSTLARARGLEPIGSGATHVTLDGGVVVPLSRRSPALSALQGIINDSRSRTSLGNPRQAMSGRLLKERPILFAFQARGRAPEQRPQE